jgi:transcription elongation GreA/GreB family factor
MSRAFVKEVEHEIEDLPDRPVSAHPNLVTAEGLAAIERTLGRFEAANKAAVAKNDRTAIAATQRELRYWKARRSSAKLVEPTADKSKVNFGATVTVQRDDSRTQTFRIVGEDEAEPARGTISYVSPLARATWRKGRRHCRGPRWGRDHYGNHITRKLVQARRPPRARGKSERKGKRAPFCPRRVAGALCDQTATPAKLGSGIS